MSIRIAYQEVAANAERPQWEIVNGSFSGNETGIGISEYQSNETAGRTGYQFDAPFSLHATFDAIPTIRGFSIGFSANCYCTHIRVTRINGEISRTFDFYPTSSAYQYYAFDPLTPATELTFEFMAASAPHENLITDFFQLGKVFIWSGDDVIDFPRIIQDVNPVSTELPFDTSEFTVYLPEERPRLQRWDAVSYFFNDLIVARHYVDTIERNYNRFTFKCISIIGVLADLQYDGYFIANGTYTTAHLLKTIINNKSPDSPVASINDTTSIAPIIASAVFDSTGSSGIFDNPTVYRGNLPAGNRRDALHRAVQAVQGLIRLLPNGTINLIRMPTTTTAIDISRVFTSYSLKRIAPYTQLTISTYAHNGGNVETLWSGTVDNVLTRIVFSAPSHVETISDGVSIISSGGTYTWWVDVQAVSNGTTTVITGQKLSAVETRYNMQFEAGGGAVQKPLEISGNDFYLYGNVDTALEQYSMYYAPTAQNAEWSGRIIDTTNALSLGNKYSIALPEGTITGWLTHKETVLSNNNRYADVTITGVWEDAE